MPLNLILPNFLRKHAGRKSSDVTLSRGAGVLIVTLLLSACNIGPKYQAPEIDAPEAFVSQDVLNMLNEGIENDTFAVDWWTGFEDEMLNQLIEQGLEGNLEIAAALADVKAAGARVDLAASGDNLTIDGTINNEVERREQIDSSSDSASRGETQAGVNLNLPLDVFGRTRRAVEVAQAELEAEIDTLKSLILSVSSEITAEYLRLRGTQRQLELLRESVELQEMTLNIVQARYNSGLSPELDLRRAETSVENLRANIPPLEEELLNTRNRLAVLSGEYPGAFETMLSEQRDIPQYQNRIPTFVPLNALSVRPDIKSAESTLKAAIAEIGVAETEYYPTFALTSDIQIGTTGVSGLPTASVFISSLALLIEQAISTGGERRANVDIARAEAESALADYELALRNAVEEVEITLAAIQSSLQRQVSLEKSVTSSQRSFFQAETLYQQGLISFLDVVDAQRVLADAEQELASERTNYATQIAILFRVLGVDVRDVVIRSMDINEVGVERPE